MSDQRLHDLGVQIEASTSMQPFEALVQRARRRVTVQRAGSLVALVALTVLAAVGAAQLANGGARSSQPAHHKEQDQRQKDIFADIHGWIVYGDRFQGDFGDLGDGIWAVDPTGRGGPDGTIHVTRQPGEEPLAWSGDGTKLLVRRVIQGALDDEDYAHGGALVVRNQDGTSIPVARPTSFFVTGSISADGSLVVYSSSGDGDGIYVVGTDGGAPRLLRAPVPRHYAGEDLARYPVGMYNPVFSPDGSRIAYFDGMGDWGHSLRVMRSDGTGVRVLIKRIDVPWHIADLAWSPDGRRLLFSGDEPDGSGIWIIGVNGSGLRKLISGGMNPAWSPDGTRLAYQRMKDYEPVASLWIADADGKHPTELGYGASGPWNPLPLDD